MSLLFDPSEEMVGDRREIKTGFSARTAFLTNSLGPCSSDINL